MNSTRSFLLAAVIGGGLAALPIGVKTASGQDFAPQRQSLTIPIAISTDRSLECVVPCGPCVPISAVAFSPDGKTLAVAGYQEVLLWDLAAAKLAKRIGTDQIPGSVHDLVFLEEGKSLAVGGGTPGSPSAVRIFHVESGEVAKTLEGSQGVIYSLAISPDGKLLAAGGTDAAVHVWNIEDQKVVTKIDEPAGWVRGVSFSPDGKLLAGGCADRMTLAWEVGTWEPVLRIRQTEPVLAAAFSPDGAMFASAVGGRSRQTVQVQRKDPTNAWKNVGMNQAQQRNFARLVRALYPTSMPLDVVWAADSKKVYVACSDKTVKAFDPANGRLLATLGGHNDWVYSVAVSPDGSQIASGSADGVVKLHNAADGKTLATLVQLAPRSEDWLIVTAQGYVATSSAGAIQWNTTNITTPVEEITAAVEKPELVQKTLAGEKTAAPELK